MKTTDPTGRATDAAFLFRHRYKIVPAPGVPSCTLCGSPTHPETEANGHCGACVLSLAQVQREVAHYSRSCGGVPFYAHAYPPPEVK